MFALVNATLADVDAFLVLCRQIFRDLGSDYQITSPHGSAGQMQNSILFLSRLAASVQYVRDNLWPERRFLPTTTISVLLINFQSTFKDPLICHNYHQQDEHFTYYFHQQGSQDSAQNPDPRIFKYIIARFFGISKSP